MVSLTIDGKKIKVPEGTTVLGAAAQAGIEIPHLCTQKGMEPYGACRVCTVQIKENNRTRLQASCTYPVSEGLEVSTAAPEVVKGRKIILELLLARCPDVKELKDFAKKWGAPKTRFTSEITDDCILCGLCVRACRDVVGAEALAFAGRGVSRQVDVPFGYHPESCVACGLCTYVCPTGKMQMESLTASNLRAASGTEKTCRYMLMGLVSSKTCPENIECDTCPYDQFMETSLGTHPALVSGRKEKQEAHLSGPFILEYRNGYSANHTWARGINGVYMVGLDHFTASLLPPVDSVEVKNGKIEVKAGDKTLLVDMPLKGDILRVNPALEAVPRLINYSPYHRGWVAIIKPSGEQISLKNGTEALRWLDSESAELTEKKVLKDNSLDRKEISRNWASLTKQFFSGKK